MTGVPTNAVMFVVLIALWCIASTVSGECDPYTRCFGHGDYNAATKTCSCYTTVWSETRWGPYTGECCGSVNCKVNATCQHGVCGDDGITCDHCQTGWGGPNCENVTACFPWFACGPHGRCTKSRFKCECDPGWHGDLCDRSMCTVPCQFGACPNDPKKCECYDNYYSPETGCDRSYCAPGWKCENGGYCIDAKHCKCPEHYTGAHCEYISNCSVPCTHGRCNTDPGHCECETNWSGPDCSKYIGPCNNCSSVGGTCYDGPDTCTCKPGYTGPQCSVQECDGCGHGSCAIQFGKRTCTCDYAWANNGGDPKIFNPGRGPCTRILYCAVPCLNKGTCPNDPYTCECHGPYTGTECDAIQCPECCPPETCDCSDGHQHCRPSWHHDCCLVKSCFRGETLVHTSRGLIPIKDVMVGDEVVTRHEGDVPGATYLRKVDEVRKTFVSPKDLVVLRSAAEDIWVTKNHPFYSQGKGWLAAENVTILHALQSLQGEPVKILHKMSAVNLMASGSGNLVPVYDLSVFEYDRYAVGKDGLLVSACNDTAVRDVQVWGELGRPVFSSELSLKTSSDGEKRTSDDQSTEGSKTSSGLIAAGVVGAMCLVVVLALVAKKYHNRHQYKGLKGRLLVETN